MVEPCETETVEIARTIAACAVAIADRSNTALACHADYVLIIPGSPNVFRSYAGVTAVAETLVGLVAIRTGVQDNGTESFQMAEWRRLLKLVSKRVRRLVGSQSRLRKYASAVTP